ncbi:MAG: peroxiredoxin [Aggregatilineales bacterium]
MLEIGQQAPDFELLNQDGQLVRLSDLRGRKVVLFFFPKANTPGCNAQACGFRDEFEMISAANAVVFGVSADSVETLRRWKADKNLPYDLLSDPSHQMLEQWGTWGIPMLGLVKIPVVNRSYYVVGEDGRIIAGEVNIGPQDSVRQALEAVGVRTEASR